jgi:diacylglycerol kinase family enzyme
VRTIVVVNSGAGAANGITPSEVEQRVRQAFADARLAVEIRAVTSADIGDVSREAAREADVLVMGGGDGTISAGAAAVAGTDTALGVLPLGTLNHFAKDLSIPLALDEAVAVIAQGHTRSVDVGEVNGRTFLNNCSLGLYPDLVRERDQQEERKRRGWWAVTRAGWASLKRFRAVTVTVEAAERVWRLTTPMVFVGNNRYEMKLFAMGRRQALDGGLLWLYLVRAGRFGLLRLVLHAILGRLDQSQDFEELGVREVKVRTWKRHTRLAVDGEVVLMRSPLECRVRPRALRVLAPPASPAAP